MHTGEGAARSQWRPQAPGLSCPSSACARDPESPALPRAALKTTTIRHPLTFLPQVPSCTRNALSTRPFPRGLSPPSALRAALGFDTTSPTPAPLSWHRHEGLPGRHCHLQDPADEQEGSIPLC